MPPPCMKALCAQPLFLTGGIFLAEGAEMLIMGWHPRFLFAESMGELWSQGSITSLLHRHWDLDPVIRGGMVSIVAWPV